MGIPVNVVASGGLAITQATSGYGVPMSLAATGRGIAVTVVASGGLPVVDVEGGIFSATIQLSSNTLMENSAEGTAIGTLSVISGTGTYTFSLTDTAGNKAKVTGTNGVNLQAGSIAANYEAATSFAITVSADNGVDDPIVSEFVIIVNNVVDEPVVVSVIYTDDLGSDTDGMSALGILNAFADLGLCEILAVCCSSPFAYGASAMKACMTYSGRGSVPIGAYQGTEFSATDYHAEFVCDKFYPAKPVRSTYPTAVAVMRQALVDSAGGVVLIETGPPVNTRDLLASSADGISSLTGVQLVTAKCARLVQMGGQFPGGPHSSYNFIQVANSQAYVIANCPVPITFIGDEVGTGVTVSIGSTASDYNLTTSPYRYGTFNLPTSFWDPCAVYIAIMGIGTDFTLTRGTCAANAAGANTWTDSPSGPHYYVNKVLSNTLLTKKFNELFQASYLAPVALSSVPMPTISMDFEQAVYTGASISDLTCVRAVGGTALDLAGTAVPFSANELRITDRGLYVNASDQITVGGTLKAALAAAGPATILYTIDGMTPATFQRFMGVTTGHIGAVNDFAPYYFELWNGTTAIYASAANAGEGTDWVPMTVAGAAWSGSHRKLVRSAGAVTSESTAMGDHTGMRLGQNLSGGENMIGFYRRIDVWDTELSDNDLRAMASALGYQWLRQEGLAPAATLPVNTVPPAITGTEEEGETLTCTTGTWTGTATITYTYQWYQAVLEDPPDDTDIVTDMEGDPLLDDPISGATSSSYVIQASDDGERLFCIVTATNGEGSESEFSNVTDVIGGVGAEGGDVLREDSSFVLREDASHILREVLEETEDAAETTAFLARTSGLNSTHIDAYKALINGLVADGVFAKLDGLYVLATQNATTAKLNLVSSSYELVPSVAPAAVPIFVADEGYSGDLDGGATHARIDTQFNPFTAGGHYTQNSAHFGIWTLTDGPEAEAASSQLKHGFLDLSGVEIDTSVSIYSAGSNLAQININSGFVAQLQAANSSPGYVIGNRSASNAQQLYLNGSSAATNSEASVALTNAATLWICSRHYSGGTNQSSDEQVAVCHFGESLSSGDVSDLTTRLTTYLTTVGAI